MNRSLREAWTRLVGPLTPPATVVVLGTAAAAGAALGIRTGLRVGGTRGPVRGAVSGAVVGGVAFDLVGGLVSFQLAPTRAQYARSGLRTRMVFVATHLQPFVLPLLGQGTWSRAAARYLTAVIGTALLETCLPTSGSRRLVANAVAATASVLDLAIPDLVPTGPGQRWFGPVYLIKLVGGHGGVPRTTR